LNKRVSNPCFGLRFYELADSKNKTMIIKIVPLNIF